MMSAQCQDFIIKSLDKNYKTRLGANGSDEIKKHPWFKGNLKIIKIGVRWNTVRQKKAPLLPQDLNLTDNLTPVNRKIKKQQEYEKWQLVINGIEDNEQGGGGQQQSSKNNNL